jgi:hypothetical protein
MLIRAVTGAEVVADGLLQLTRNVLLSAVSGAADIGTEALTATVSGARGVVSAASRMVGNIAGAAQSGVQDVVASVRQSGGRPPTRGARRPPARVAGRIVTPGASSTQAGEETDGRSARRLRAARQPRTEKAA